MDNMLSLGGALEGRSKVIFYGTISTVMLGAIAMIALGILFATKSIAYTSAPEYLIGFGTVLLIAPFGVAYSIYRTCR